MTRFNTAKTILLSVLALGILLSLSMMGAPVSRAAPATSVSISPPTQTVDAGQLFTVDVVVDPDVAIVGVQFSLGFDPSLITVNSVTEGNLLPQGGASTYFTAGTIDNVAGTLTTVAGAIVTPGQTISSPGTFATINFTANADGTSLLDLSNVIVANLPGQLVTITVTEGSVIVGCVTSDTPSLVSPSDGQSDVSMSASLDWCSVSNATSYDVELCSDSGCTSVVRSANVGSSHWTVSPALDQETQYWWRARANSSSGAGSWSSVRSFTTTCPIPGTPSLVSPSNVQSRVSMSATLDWSDVSNATSYDVELCSDSGCTSVVRSANVGSSQWTVSPALNQGTEYYWHVRAKNSCGFGSWSSVWTLTTQPTIYVPDDYPTIQAAVDAAGVGDTIMVYAGIYQEHVTLYKSVILQTDEGAVIDGGGSLSTVTITAEGCTMSGFNITGSGSHPNENAGIRIDSDANTISGNTISRNKEDGILLNGGDNAIMNNSVSENEGNGLYINWGYGNTVEGNTISANRNYGLCLNGYNNILRGNVMTGNGLNFHVQDASPNDVDTSNTVDGKPIYYLVGVQDELIASNSNAGYVLAIDSENITIRDLALANNDKGVWLCDCYKCLIDNVITQDNDDYGIYLQGCSYCTAQNCTISGGARGIYLSGSIGNLVTSNIIQASRTYGIVLDDSDGNFLIGNIVRDNQSGIVLSGSYDCRIEHNLVTQNEYDGISIDRGRGHLIYGNIISINGGYGVTMWQAGGNDIRHNNFVDNGENAGSGSNEETNSWDNGAEGNYWGDYEERYPDAEEIDETGIWDALYEIPGDTGDKDHYPLVEPFENLVPNQPPDEPDNPSPADDAIGVSTDADLSWSSGDPDAGDTVTYEVYFGTNATPPLKDTIGPYSAVQSSLTYDLPALGDDTTYYWRIVAKDNHGITTGGFVWNFTTARTGDANNDDHVNVLDMILIAQHWGQAGSPGWIAEDVTKDGVVNVLDMIVIGQNWTG